MTEKVKLTHEQAEAFKIYKEAGHNLAVFAANSRGFHGHYESLKTLSIDELGRILYEPNSYEIEPQFKVGDWIARVDQVTFDKGEKFMRITGFDGEFVKFAPGRSLRPKLLRKATPEEIKTEKERRLWKNLGRKVGEFKKGDIRILNDGNSVHITDVDYARVKYIQGRLKGFYPVESFISFESVEEG